MIYIRFNNFLNNYFSLYIRLFMNNINKIVLASELSFLAKYGDYGNKILFRHKDYIRVDNINKICVINVSEKHLAMETKIVTL